MNSPLHEQITPGRLEELVRWHGTDESNLPPAHTLRNLSRDTIAALEELRRARERIERLRAAMGRAFWAADARELHTILLEALGPPPGARDDAAVPDHPTAADLHGASGAGPYDWPVKGAPS